ncbi:hypothetical protein [Brachybacterium fresconis]|uniref:Uncharacterized protein n=1 Tax=Brachybacterium fresconis TaxID=173363 RepID=A0ABS4YFD9_9MICO|nr:hypothetical protein [Brachybacterium fresconis]MBP2407325.1 hypothetical protein [Brachybacterium fresconis]
MSDTDHSSIPLMIRQGQLIDEIASQVPLEVEGEWSKLIYIRTAVSMNAQEEMRVYRPDGSVGSALPPLDMEDLSEELRKVMYRDGVGTWFTATWTLEREESGEISVSSEFDYENEPKWDASITASTYAIELEDFPRDEENIPEWLKRKVLKA